MRGAQTGYDWNCRPERAGLGSGSSLARKFVRIPSRLLGRRDGSSMASKQVDAASLCNRKRCGAKFGAIDELQADLHLGGASENLEGGKQGEQVLIRLDRAFPMVRGLADLRLLFESVRAIVVRVRSLSVIRRLIRLRRGTAAMAFGRLRFRRQLACEQLETAAERVEYRRHQNQSCCLYEGHDWNEVVIRSGM